MSGTELLLVLNESDGAELFRDGTQVWASDSDPDVLEALGTDLIEPADIADVLDYLVDANLMTDAEADECAVDSPDEEDDEERDEEDETDTEEAHAP